MSAEWRKLVLAQFVLLAVSIFVLAISSSSQDFEKSVNTIEITPRTNSLFRRSRSADQLPLITNKSTTADNNNNNNSRSPTNSSTTKLHIQATAIHVDESEFPLSKLLFKLTLKLALEAASKRLERSRVKLSLSIRSANTCSRQYASALAAEEYYKNRARLFIVSGCDDAIRGVSQLASGWRVPVMTATGFGADLDDKTVYKTLVRVAFSLRAAVEFLFKIMRTFQWHRVNLIVDISDPNSLALKGTIEKHLIDYKIDDFQVKLNTIPLDMRSLMTGRQQTTLSTNESFHHHNSNESDDDKWPNEITERTIQGALKQSSMYSRVNILLLPQHYLRKFMLSVYDQNMGNGLYTFVNMPLLLITNDDQMDGQQALLGSNSSKLSYVAPTGENVFVWRSLRSSRNSQAKQAFESLMSIYLRTPKSKAYLYIVSKLIDLANMEYGTTTTTTTTTTPANYSTQQQSKFQNSKESFANGHLAKIQLNINPYSASFYDCLQIYSIVLNESLTSITQESRSRDVKKRLLRYDLHARIIELIRNKRFDNMATGTISINSNGDRETDYTLDDMNQVTGKFNPVILYRGHTREIERLARIHWSSDPLGRSFICSICYGLYNYFCFRFKFSDNFLKI